MVRPMPALASKFIFLLFLFLFTSEKFAFAIQNESFVGTFSSLIYNAQSGDLTGYEVHLIPTNLGLKAVVQVAEGDAGRLYVVDATIKGDEIELRIPLVSGAAGLFKGRLSGGGIDGSISFPSGFVEKVFLKKTRSYWEK